MILLVDDDDDEDLFVDEDEEALEEDFESICKLILRFFSRVNNS